METAAQTPTIRPTAGLADQILARILAINVPHVRVGFHSAMRFPLSERGVIVDFDPLVANGHRAALARMTRRLEEDHLRKDRCQSCGRVCVHYSSNGLLQHADAQWEIASYTVTLFTMMCLQTYTRILTDSDLVKLTF